MRTIRGIWIAAGLGIMTAATIMSARSSVGSTSANLEPAQSSLQGSWMITVTPTPGLGVPPPFKGLITFAPNGGLTETDTVAPILGISGTGGHGAWGPTGGSDFATTFVKLLVDKNGQFAGTLKFRETGKLNQTLDGYTSAGRLDIAGASGAVLASTTAAIQATRIRVEPVQ